jgi:hypothetical protein
MAPDDAKQSILTHWQQKAARKALPRPATQRETEMVNQSFQPRRPACEGTGYRHVKRLNEDPPTAIDLATTESAHLDLDPDQFPLGWQVGQKALVPGVDTL